MKEASFCCPHRHSTPVSLFFKNPFPVPFLNYTYRTRGGGFYARSRSLGILLRNNPAKKLALNVITGADKGTKTCTSFPLFLIPRSTKYPE